MNKFEHQLHKVAQTIRLSRAERTAMRERLVEYMGHAPARTERAKADAHGAPRWRVAVVSILRVKYVPAALILALVFVTGGGVSMAAGGALPGELLYPVKVGINEEVRGVLAFSEAEKTQWEAERVERRLEEAEILAFSGQFDDKARRAVEKAFSKNINTLAQRIERDGNDASAIELAARLEGTLSAHESILSSLADRTGGAARAFANRVKEEGRQVAGRFAVAEAATTATLRVDNGGASADDRAEDVRTLQQAETTTLPAPAAGRAEQATAPTATTAAEEGEDKAGETRNEDANGRRTAVALGEKARERIEATQNILDEITDAGRVDAQALEQARDVLDEADNLIDDGDNLVEDGEYGRARAAYRTALSLSQRIDVLLHAGVRVGAFKALSETFSAPEQNDVDRLDADILPATGTPQSGSGEVESEDDNERTGSSDGGNEASVGSGVRDLPIRNLAD